MLCPALTCNNLIFSFPILTCHMACPYLCQVNMPWPAFTSPVLTCPILAHTSWPALKELTISQFAFESVCEVLLYWAAYSAKIKYKKKSHICLFAIMGEINLCKSVNPCLSAHAKLDYCTSSFFPLANRLEVPICHSNYYVNILYIFFHKLFHSKLLV